MPSDRHRRRGCQRGTAAERGGGRAAGEKRIGRRRPVLPRQRDRRNGLTPQQIAEQIAAGKLDITRSAVCTAAEREAALKPYIDASIAKIAANRQRRENYIATIGEGPRPYLYVIVATGNIYEDVVQAQAAARQGADIIAVIRTTGQSLLDYVPYGATTEGFGGTFATQENFRIMRKALDEVGEEVGRYIRLCNYCSGLCMPEIAVMGALEGLDVMLNDALYGILFRDINMQRTLVDQYMSRVINGFAGVIINTGEDNYLTTADAVEEAHTVLASDLINEQLALLAGLPRSKWVWDTPSRWIRCSKTASSTSWRRRR